MTEKQDDRVMGTILVVSGSADSSVVGFSKHLLVKRLKTGCATNFLNKILISLYVSTASP